MELYQGVENTVIQLFWLCLYHCITDELIDPNDRVMGVTISQYFNIVKSPALQLKLAVECGI